MALFVGKHVNKVDKKGRVSVPKVFRASLQGDGFSGLYAYPLFKHQAIEACSEDFLNRLSESLDDLALFSDEQDDLAAVILENAHPLAFDPEGRITLPQELLSHAAITNEAVFVGRGARMRIWQPAAYKENNALSFERARARGATLPLKPPLKPGNGKGGQV